MASLPVFAAAGGSPFRRRSYAHGTRLRQTARRKRDPLSQEALALAHWTFVVTNLPAKGFKGDKDKSPFNPARLYEELYCARGDMENKLKQQVLDLRADRMSTHHMASNQLRLWEAMSAYLLLERLRTQGLSGTELERATAGSLRLSWLSRLARAPAGARRLGGRDVQERPLVVVIAAVVKAN